MAEPGQRHFIHPELERDIFAEENQRLREAAAAERTERERLQAVERAARRLATALPYYHELTDYVEYEAAYHDLCRVLGIKPEWPD